MIFIVFFKFKDILILLNLKMSQNLQQQKQKVTKEAKRRIKILNKKATKQNRQNVLKSETKPENQKCHNFVKLNRRKTYDKLEGIFLDIIKEFGNKGYNYL